MARVTSEKVSAPGRVVVVEVSELPVVSVPLHLPQLVGLVAGLELLVVHQVAEVQPVGHIDELSPGPDDGHDGDDGDDYYDDDDDGYDGNDNDDDNNDDDDDDNDDDDNDDEYTCW